MALKPRQEQVLRAVVEEFIASGFPVGSQHLRETAAFEAAASTIRNDLGRLEELGLLDHPHTSAGRVPTDAGYRYYADTIIAQRAEIGQPPAIDLRRVQAQIDDALEETADALSRVTEMLAIVSSPSLSSTTIRHIEVLSLQPSVMMIVIITSSGRVTKRIFRFERPVDEGLADYARVYLNERLAGRQLGTRVIDAVLDSSELGPTERGFLSAVRPAFRVAVEQDAEALHMGGTARLLERLSDQGATRLDELVALLEERFNLLEILSEALRGDDVFLRIGAELNAPSLQACSLVAANYGVANRNLGTVSVLGPVRMDYQRTIMAVRAAAGSLSSYLEETW